MNTAAHPSAVLILMASLCLSPALGAREPPPNPSDPSVAFLDPDDPLARPVASLGETAINQLAAMMLRDLSSSIAKEGLAGAAQAGHLRKLARDQPPLPSQPAVLRFKRTSLRSRSPQNAPDAADKSALLRFEMAYRRGEDPPRLLVQRVVSAAGRAEWRVYRPLAVATACLPCHGDSSQRPPEVAAVLERLYPGDPAVDYQPGEWRGFLRVTIADTTDKPRP